MHIFTEGIKITEIENHCLLYIVSNPEQWLQEIINKKIIARRTALINEWQSTLFNDPEVTDLPADEHALAELIMSRPDYKTRIQRDEEYDSLRIHKTHNLDRFNGDIEEGVARIPSDASITLCESGIELADGDWNCIHAYVRNMDDWVIGALLGLINRGKKTMLRAWKPIILADPDVSTMPATEEGLINMIVARDDYKSMSG